MYCAWENAFDASVSLYLTLPPFACQLLSRDWGWNQYKSKERQEACFYFITVEREGKVTQEGGKKTPKA